MPIKNRIKISASLNSFEKEIDRLKKFDFANQQKFATNKLTRAQIELLVETVFFYSFRAYESFIREVFLLYCMEKQSSKKPKVKSYLKAKDFEHTELLIKSSMPFLDWTSPKTIIERAELYLVNGYPVKLPYSANLQPLQSFKKIRNHIAHNSIESEDGYKKVVKSYYGVVPLQIPTPGQYLMLSSKTTTGNYLLLDFFDLMKTIAADLT